MKPKMAYIQALCLGLFLLTSCSQPNEPNSTTSINTDPVSVQADDFVSVKHGKFELNHRPYYFAGANFWHAGYLGAERHPGDRQQLIRELDVLKANGITNLRVLAVSEASELKMALNPAIQSEAGQLDESLLQGLDFLLVELAKRDMKAILFLNNFWQWSGGMSQYVAWQTAQPVVDPDVTGDWNGFMQNSAKFYRMPEAQKVYQQVIKTVVGRTNSISGVKYSNDPAIMTWELANEPRPGSDADGQANTDAFIQWVDNTATFIHQLAPHQLVTTGSEGVMGTLQDEDIYLRAHNLPAIDYITFHMWPKNWSWFDINHPEATYQSAVTKAQAYVAKHIQYAAQLNKPVVMEEFGIERDNGDYRPSSTTQWRDKFFSEIFNQWYQAGQSGANIGGTNFWAWSGEARTQRDDFIWQSGDPFFGDPPQEPQGLNSVFDQDSSTLAVIAKHAAQMEALTHQPSTADKVEALLSQMTLAEKIGQMTQAERNHATPEDVKNYFLGSILNGGGSVPGDNTPQDWRDMIDAYQHAALSTRLAIPFIYGTDAVHGHGNGKNTTLFPHNVGLGAMRNPELMEKIGRITAAETTAFGVHWNFGPALCVSRDERWGRAYECYGEDPEIGESYAGPYVTGSQASGQMIATAKHWVGDGGTTYGTGDHEYIIDRGDTRVSMDELRKIHIAPYLPAFKAGVASVMYSYSSVNGLKMHENQLLNNMLKNELGFDGFVVSDWQAIEEVQGETNRERIVRSINAGLDMAMEPEFWKEFITDLTAAVNDGEVPLSRIDDAVRRILTAKFNLGLFDRPYTADRTIPAKLAVGTPEHRAVAREAVAESLVMLKNENNLLPLSKTARIFVAGSHADNIGLQSGGWSIQWQGEKQSSNQGTTILQGIQALAGDVTYAKDGQGAQSSDVAIVVVGENPYAEGWGDYNVQPCQYCQPLTLSAEDLATIENVKASGVPFVVVLVSGRPLLISEQLPDWNALVAAWLPGTEGAGVADVLFGDHPMGGKLGVSWPVNLEQIPINVGDKDYHPLFEYGYGLTYP
ncbi:glycoside hydrolase family 3 N-terminal domain-containing protein [Neptunicella sp.]|uniref:glycoside hydrolase family 3 N-terminal domain-containing protein n=1 Tax=Neptunicella sp. TaxID=2125986 RepID=UPI003F692C27